MPADPTAAHLRIGIASGAHAGKGEAKRRGAPYGGKFMRRSRSSKLVVHSQFLGAQALVTTCSEARMSTIRDVRMV